MSTGIPAPRDDDPEEVSDKLSIAAAMWARGETADAISWLRRAATSAADAEADDRALELAKAAADLSTSASAPAPSPAPAPAPAPAPRTMGMTVPTGTKPVSPSAIPPSRPPTNAPPKPPPSRTPSSSAMAAAQPPVPTTAKSIASRPAPRPSATPAPAGTARLAPLPPLRPLGTASQLARPSTSRSSSTMKAVNEADATQPSSSASMRAAQESTLQEPANTPLSDAIDHDQTSVMPAAKARELFQSAEQEASPMRVHDDEDELASEEDELRQTMRRDAEEHTPVPAGEDRPSGRATVEAISGEPPTRNAGPLPTLEAIRVRVHATEGGAWIVPDAPGAKGGVVAILVPQGNPGDLRSVFEKK